MLRFNYLLVWYLFLCITTWYLIYSAPCTKQPLSFGMNCSFVCHCLHGDCDSRTEGLGCFNGPCSPGYTGIPGCQEVCEPGKFGVDCQEICMCEPLNICEPTNGNCIGSNKCKAPHFGPSCQMVRAQLLVPPNATTDCKQLRISWPGVSSRQYSGPSDLAGFVLFEKHRNGSLYRRPGIIPYDHNTSIYSFPLYTEKETELHRIAVRADFYIDTMDRYIEKGVLSPFSNAIAVKCPAPQNVITLVSNATITIAWQSPNVPHVPFVGIVANLTKRLACPETLLNRSTSNVKRLSATSGIYQFSGENWCEYSMEVYGLTQDGTTTLSFYTTAKTSMTVPSGRPTHLFIKDVTSTSGVIDWEFPDCAAQRGSFKRFRLQATPMDTHLVVAPLQRMTNMPPVRLSNMIPRTNYRFSVAFENPLGVGPEATIDFITKPVQLQVDSIDSDSCTLTWHSTLSSYRYRGLLTGLRLESQSRSRPPLLKIYPLAPDSNEFRLSGLMSTMQYEVTLYILLGSSGDYSESVVIQTPPNPQLNGRLPLQLGRRTSSEITVTWEHPHTDSHKPSRYVVDILLLSSELPTVPSFTTRRDFITSKSSEYTFTSLPAASLFRVSVSISSSLGVSIRNTSLNIWTAPAPFTDSVSLKKVNELRLMSYTIDKLTLRFPVVTGYQGGPMNYFHLAVSVISLTEPVSHQADAIVVYRSTEWPQSTITVDVDYLSRAGLPTINSLNSPINLAYCWQATVSSVVDNATEVYLIDQLTVPVHAIPLVGSSSLLTSLEQQQQQEEEELSRQSGIVVGLVLGSLTVLLALSGIASCLVYYLCLRNSVKFSVYLPQKLNNKGYATAEKSTANNHKELLPQSFAWWSVPTDIRAPRCLIVDPAKGPKSTLVGTWSKQELVDHFTREFACLRSGYQYAHTAGERAINWTKNRSQQHIPYDHNRVTLDGSADTGHTDYINANFVDGYLRRRAYIAAQSPFDTPSACDFWQMVFQQNVAQIVVLTNLVEEATLQCCQYWPELPTNIQSDSNSSLKTANDCSTCTQRFGDLLVKVEDRVTYAQFSVHHFTLSNALGKVQHVTQYHFHNWLSPKQSRRMCSGDEPTYCWPTHSLHAHDRASGDKCSPPASQRQQPVYRTAKRSVPMQTGCNGVDDSEENLSFDRLAFIEFYYRVKTASQIGDGPVLVHCGSDFSRTGLYIAFDILLQQANNEHLVSVCQTCARFVKSRCNMLPHYKHYLLLYDLLFEAMLAGHCIVDLDVPNIYRALQQKNSRSGFSYLSEQWIMLHLYTPSPDVKTQLTSALSSTNLKYNRYKHSIDLLPPDEWLPRLRPRGITLIPENSRYINAVYLDGVGLRDDVILTQTPLSVSVNNFWQLIDEEKVSCIVDMEPFSYGVEEAIRYWPLRPREVASSALFEGSSDEDREEHGCGSDQASDYRGPWCSVAGGYLEVCQIGQLTPIQLDIVGKRRTASHGIYRRRLLMRRREAIVSRNHPDLQDKRRPHELRIFHFAGDWNITHQIPESRIAVVRLLEAVRLERGTGPLLIHCLDGATRSGLMGCCHLLAERMTRDHYVDLFHVIKAVKIRRRAVLASQGQLRFIYRFLAQWIKQTLGESLSTWLKSQGSAKGSPLQWPPLVGHLPPMTRLGIFQRSQLPTTAPVPTVGEAMGTVNASNSGNLDVPNQTVSCSTDRSILYHYFRDELQSLTYSKIDQLPCSSSQFKQVVNEC